jgi:DNA-binding MarR family transcriptional regulator/GNAT superfamily N-acetyltransferase
MDQLKNLGALALGSRFRRLSDRLMQDGILIYRDTGLNFEPKWFPVYIYLKEMGPTAVMDIARGLGITHPSVNQTAKEMMSVGLVAAYKDTSDKRKRVLALTTAGKAKLTELEPAWSRIRDALQELIDETQVDFLGYISIMESALDRKSFYQRYFDMDEQGRNQQGQNQRVLKQQGLNQHGPNKQEKSNETNSVELVTFTENMADDFRSLNEDWINEYFEMEDADRKTLDDPGGSIIGMGGEIVFARDVSTLEVLGTCAIIRCDDALCELAKMAVAKSARGRGIGKLVGKEAIRVAQEMGFMKMYLETNTRLSPALGLYRQLGFERRDFPRKSDYSRADVYMDIDL